MAVSSSELKLKHQILTTPTPCVSENLVFRPTSFSTSGIFKVLRPGSQSQDRLDKTGRSCGERWALLGSGDAGNNPRCGRGQPLWPRRHVVPWPLVVPSGACSGDHISASVPFTSSPQRPFGIASGLHCCWKEAGPLPLKLPLLLGSYGRPPAGTAGFWLGPPPRP